MSSGLASRHSRAACSRTRNLGALSRNDLARLREVTASQGLMLESLRPDLAAHAASPTKDPQLRLQTIRDAGELRIPFTSGILVGIGESPTIESPRSKRSPSVNREHGHLQEVILQNFVPHRRYYGEEPAEIATAAAEEYWRTGLGRHPELPLPGLGLRDHARGHQGARRRARASCSPGSASRFHQTSRDAWPELVRAGATDLGGLSANGDHISPEHPFPSPHQVRRRLQQDGIALTERLCVYGNYIDPEWQSQGVLDVIKARYWSFIPRRGSGRQTERSIRRDLVPGAVAKGRDGVVLERGGADRALRRDARRRRSRTSARRPTSCAPSSPARP